MSEGAGLVDLSLWDRDAAALVEQVRQAAVGTGFLNVYNHGIPDDVVEAAFAASRSFFALPDEVKARTPFVGWAGGWEKEKQGTADLKESFQIGYTQSCEASWPGAADLPEFRATCLTFMHEAARVSTVLLRCLARALELPEGAMVSAHDPGAEDVQTVLRLLHYPPIAHRGDVDLSPGARFRAGAHTDFDVLTLLFQRVGEGGLEVCPGRTASTEFGHGDTWLPVPPVKGCITCNLGDMLMRWSDDRAMSTFHRVVAPPRDDPAASAPRYSIAYFNQACQSTVIGGAGGKYAALTGRQFLQQSIERNFAALKARETVAAAPE